MFKAYFFHRTPLVAASQHEIQASTTTAGREQQEEFRDSLDNENTNEKEENSTKQTNNKSPEDELDIELFLLLVLHFPDLNITATKNLHGTISALPQKISMYATESMFFHCRSNAI